jgi:hypothetical protein
MFRRCSVSTVYTVPIVNGVSYVSTVSGVSCLRANETLDFFGLLWEILSGNVSHHLGFRRVLGNRGASCFSYSPGHERIDHKKAMVEARGKVIDLPLKRA